MKYETMLKIFLLLLARGVTSAACLADRFEISRRSVYRYLDALGAAGIPILVKRGQAGGYYIPDSYKLSASFFTEEELAAAVAAIDNLQSTVYSEAGGRAKEKLLALKRDLPRDYKLASGYVIVDGAPWGDARGYRNKLDVAMRALEERRMMRIRYHDRDGNVTEREIEPHYLVLKQGLTYLYAWCRLRGGFRFFKMGRIEFATLLYDSYERRETPDFETATEFRRQAGNIEIELAVDRSARSDVEEWLGIENVTERRDGEIRATAILPDDKSLVANLLSYGTSIRVLTPYSLVRRIRGALGELGALYA